MRKIVLIILLALSFFVAACSDGDDGAAGITGVKGCDFDQKMDDALGYCVTNASYEAPVSGNDGATGAKGCDFDEVWDSAQGFCIGNTNYNVHVDVAKGEDGPAGPPGCDAGKTRNINTQVCE